MSEQHDDTLPTDAPEFFSKYADKNFLDDFAKKYSIEDATKLLVAVDDVVASGDKKEIFRAKDALSWSSELRHQYFVTAKPEDRFDLWEGQSPITKGLKLVLSELVKAVDKMSEKAASKGLMMVNTALYAGVAVAATTMGLPALAVGAVAAVPAALALSKKFLDQYEDGKKPFETMEKAMSFLDMPPALKSALDKPENMPLRTVEQSIVAGRGGTMSKEDVDGYRSISVERLGRTFGEMPACVKLLSHFKSLDQLVEMADKYQEKVKSVPFSQKDTFKREFAIEAFKETAQTSSGVVNTLFTKLLNEASIDGVKDAVNGIKTSLADKLAERRRATQSQAPDMTAKAPAFN